MTSLASAIALYDIPWENDASISFSLGVRSASSFAVAPLRILAKSRLTPDAQRLGLDLKDWVGTDANGYNFGPDMLSATEDGKWVSYVYQNPESGGIGAGYTG